VEIKECYDLRLMSGSGEDWCAIVAEREAGCRTLIWKEVKDGEGLRKRRKTRWRNAKGETAVT
jgi:hypothetical protein